MILRPYQVDAVARVRSAYASGSRRIMLVSPTGSGKTQIGCAIVAGAIAKGKRVLWLTHRRELIGQASARLASIGVDHGVILAGAQRRSDMALQVASVQTLTARGEVPDDVRMVVCDEAHRATSMTWRAIVDACPSIEMMLGLTATPERGDGTAMGDVFDSIVESCSVSDLQAQGYLVPCDVVAPASPSKELAQDPVEGYLALGGMPRAVVFGATVAHAQALADSFRLRGVAAECVDGETPKAIRASALARFARGDTRAITNCAVLTEGTDIPSIEVIIVARGCSAWSTWIQMIGRGLRPAPGKARCTVLDLRGHVHVHGLPDDKRLFSLDGTASSALTSLPSLSTCDSCGACWRATSARECPRCGVERPAPPPPVVLEQPIERVAVVATWAEKRAHFNALVRQSRERGWKPNAIGVKFKHKFGHWPGWGILQ